MDFSEVSFILRGKRRKLVFMAFNSSAKTITELKKELKLNLANVSNTVKELESKGFVECKNPKDYHYKFYSLTKKGIKVKEDIVVYEKSK